jgi:hypothetical protein
MQKRNKRRCTKVKKHIHIYIYIFHNMEGQSAKSEKIVYLAATMVLKK